MHFALVISPKNCQLCIRFALFS